MTPDIGHNSFAIEIIVPGKPQGKGRPKFSRKGRAYTPEATANYEAVLKFASMDAYRGPPLEGALDVEVHAFMPIPASWSKKKQEAARLGMARPIGKPDGDNIAKMVDACNGVLWKDDGQLTDWLIRKRYSDEPRLVLRVKPIVFDFME